MSTEAFLAIVKDWLASAKQPRFQRPYTDLVYQPMLEVMNYLRANDFKIYIVTGGGTRVCASIVGAFMVREPKLFHR